jgi:hypothetical protein
MLKANILESQIILFLGGRKPKGLNRMPEGGIP